LLFSAISTYSFAQFNNGGYGNGYGNGRMNNTMDQTRTPQTERSSCNSRKIMESYKPDLILDELQVIAISTS
jgi:hypothetical protein